MNDVFARTDETIQFFVLNDLGLGATGLTDLFVRLFRNDGLWFDWDDFTFKAKVDVLVLDKILSERDPDDAPGVYAVAGGLDTTGPEFAERSFLAIPEQDPRTVSLPVPSELRVLTPPVSGDVVTASSTG